jgi:hypothetical protein
LSPIELVRMRALFYEKRVRSFEKLMLVIRRLDSDSGVRVVGSYLKRACFVFLTRSGGTYTVMLNERTGGKAPAPGARILSREFESADDLGRFLRQITKKGVDAYVY